jgi:hypothetical protein
VSYFQVVPGQEVESAHMNAAIRQGVPPFANAAARDAAIPAPVAGQTCYLEDIKQGQAWRTAWRPAWGTMPTAVIQWGGGALPSGWTVLSHAPSSQVSQGAAWTINATNGGATIPYAGYWLVTIHSDASSYVGTASNALYKASAAWQYGSTINVATTASQIVNSFIVLAAAGDVARPAINASAAGAFTIVKMSLAMLSD